MENYYRELKKKNLSFVYLRSRWDRNEIPIHILSFPKHISVCVGFYIVSEALEISAFDSNVDSEYDSVIVLQDNDTGWMYFDDFCFPVRDNHIELLRYDAHDAMSKYLTLGDMPIFTTYNFS